MPVDSIEEHLREDWVVCTARVSGSPARTPRGRVLERIDVFHGEIPERFEIVYDWFEPSKPESAYNVKLVLGRDHLFCLKPDDAFPGRFALAGTSWVRNQPVEYFEKGYPDFLPALPTIVRTERIGDEDARRAAWLRLLGANDELAAYAARRLTAWWSRALYPRDRAVLEEIEAALVAFCASSERDWRVRHYALGRIASESRHDGDPIASDVYELLVEMAAREPESALRWRAAATLRWLASARRLLPRDGFSRILDACVEALARESNTQVCEELARAIAACGPSDDVALAPLERAGPEKRFLAAVIRDHWLSEDRASFDMNRFSLRRGTP